MKVALLILMTGGLSLGVMCQDTTLTFNDVVKVDGVSKNDLMSRGRVWFTEHFKSVKEQNLDSQVAIISGKAFFKTVIASKSILDEKDTYEIWYVGNVWIKEGRYKYQFTNYEVQKDGLTTAYGTLTSATDPPNIKGLMGKGSKRSTWQGCRKDVEKQTEELINSLKAAMVKPSATEF